MNARSSTCLSSTATTAGTCRFPRPTSSTAMARCSTPPRTRITRSDQNQRMSYVFYLAPQPFLGRHPECSRFSGGAKDLPSGRSRAPAFDTTSSQQPQRLQLSVHLEHAGIAKLATDNWPLATAPMNYIYGINAVTEALKARGRAFQWVGMAKERHDIRLQRLIEDCRKLGVPVKFLTRTELDQMAGRAAHQGVVAVTSAKQYSDLDDVVGAKMGRYSFVVVLDGVEDPHNLGAVLRTADAAGADGVVIPERRAAPVTGTVTKASAGASEYLPIAKVTNIARTVEELKERNIWTVGLDERGKQTYDALDYNMDCALVLGAEGKGLHDLVKKKCDFLVSIPMLGKVPSLNVSVAGAVVMYEIVRQRRAKDRTQDKGAISGVK